MTICHSASHRHRLERDELKHLLDGLYAEIDQRANTPAADKEDIKAEVKEIQSPLLKPRSRMKKWRKDFYLVAFATLRGWLQMCWMSL